MLSSYGFALFAALIFPLVVTLWALDERPRTAAVSGVMSVAALAFLVFSFASSSTHFSPYDARFVAGVLAEDVDDAGDAAGMLAAVAEVMAMDVDAVVFDGGRVEATFTSTVVRLHAPVCVSFRPGGSGTERCLSGRDRRNLQVAAELSTSVTSEPAPLDVAGGGTYVDAVVSLAG